MTTTHADEIEPGDVMVYDGHIHILIPVDWRVGWAWHGGADTTGWALALGHQLVDVHREAA